MNDKPRKSSPSPFLFRLNPIDALRYEWQDIEKICNGFRKDSRRLFFSSRGVRRERVKLGYHTAIVAIMLSTSGLLSCSDETVYHPDEIRAEKKFQTIGIGITEEELTRQLGQPTGRLVFDNSRGTYQYFTLLHDGPIAEFRPHDGVIEAHPRELRFLPGFKQAKKILVFVDGTVYGYFYFGQSERVEDKAVFVS